MSDRSTRGAALWSAAIAVPIAVLAGVLIFGRLAASGQPAAQPSPPPSSAGVAPVPSTPVPMAAPKLSQRTAAVCLAVTSQLPNEVRTLAARKVTAGPEQNAAYGEPALTVACGVERPVMCAAPGDVSGSCVPLEAELLNMDRVCWFAKPGSGGTTFTTMNREVPVRVTVPSAYEQAAQWANEFSDIVVETDRSVTEGVPSGCV